MRAIGTLHPTDGAPTPPDTVSSILLAAATAQAMDMPSGAKMAVLTGISTGNSTAALAVPLPFYVNMFSTAAAIPSSGTTSATNTSAGSTGVSFPIIGQRTIQVPGGSTGFSVVAPSSGWVHIEWYGK